METDRKDTLSCPHSCSPPKTELSWILKLEIILLCFELYVKGSRRMHFCVWLILFNIMFVRYSITGDLYSIVYILQLFLHSTMMNILIVSSSWLWKMQLWTFLDGLLLNMCIYFHWLWGQNYGFIPIYSVSRDTVE